VRHTTVNECGTIQIPNIHQVSDTSESLISHHESIISRGCRTVKLYFYNVAKKQLPRVLVILFQIGIHVQTECTIPVDFQIFVVFDFQSITDNIFDHIRFVFTQRFFCDFTAESIDVVHVHFVHFQKVLRVGASSAINSRSREYAGLRPRITSRTSYSTVTSGLFFKNWYRVHSRSSRRARDRCF